MRDHPVQRDQDRLIARYGWMVQAVYGDGDNLPFAYTIGLADKGLPELIVFSLPQKVTQYLLNMMAARLVAGDTLPLGQRLPDIAEGMDTVLLPVPRAHAEQYLCQAFYRNPTTTALQLVWPDKANRMPWDADHNPYFKGLQLILGTPPPRSNRGLAQPARLP